ncbi:MAG: AAA family ATPase [Actinobacteria bacterium]|nr:AAA family ATPase [Actinomycetota bacterium]
MEPSHVLVVTGPPGAGKSAVADLLASKRPRGVHLESDCFFHFIRGGYVEPWRPESHAQNTTVMSIVASAAAGYAAAGYFTIIDGIISPRWFMHPVRERLEASGHKVAYAILRAPLPVCHARTKDRGPGRPIDVDAEERLWHDFADLGDLERHVIETDGLSVDETVDLLDERLRDGSLDL